MLGQSKYRATILLVFVALALLVILPLSLRLFFDDNVSSYILSVLGLAVGLAGLMAAIFADELLLVKQQAKHRLAEHGLLKKLKTPNWLGQAARYFDLTLIIAGIVLFLPTFFSSIEEALVDLATKGFITFPENSNGIYHMKIYAMGYLATPFIFSTLALYASYRGAREGLLRLRDLFLAILFGFILSIFIRALIHGGWGSPAALEDFFKRTDIEHPIGVTEAYLFIISATLSLASLFFSLYAWFFGWISSSLARGLRSLGHRMRPAEAPSRERLDINSCPIDTLCITLGVSERTAQNVIDQRPIQSYEELLQVEGIGPRLAERARVTFGLRGPGKKFQRRMTEDLAQHPT